MTPTTIDRLRRLGARICTAAAMERRIDRGRPWQARWIEVLGVLVIVKVIVLLTLDRGTESLLRPDAEMRSALVRLGAIFGAVVTVTAVALAWLPFNTMPLPRPFGAVELLYLIPQALPVAVPIGLTIAIVIGLRASLAGRLAVWILSAAVTCSVASFLTLGWWAPSSNQAYRTRIVGREIAKGERELTLGELGTRIEEIRAFDPAAPARQLSVLYHTRWALSVTPLVLAVFALMITSHSRRRTAVRALGAVLWCGGFALLLSWTNYLAFRGRVPPSLGAWLPNITFLGATMALALRSRKQTADALAKRPDTTPTPASR
jgi:Lipopolysaccharide export system permease LptF/LptG